MSFYSIEEGGDLKSVYLTDYSIVDFLVTGNLFVNGQATYGALGNSTSTPNISSPVQLGVLNTWVSVSAGFSFSYAIRSDNTLWTWGIATSGQLGDSTIVSKSAPLQVGALTNWKQVSAGADYVLATKTDGSLWGWGNNATGKLGLGNQTNRSSPIQVGTLNDWKTPCTATRASFGIKIDGTLWAWGWNSTYNLGDGSVSSFYMSPVQIGSGTNWKYVSGGNDFSIALKTDGSIWATGLNTNGECGSNNTSTLSFWTQIGTNTYWRQIEAGMNHVLAIRQDGTLWAWGLNDVGQLGLGDRINRSSPTQVGNLTDWYRIASKMTRATGSKVIKTDGTMWAWGRNSYGELGTNNLTFYSSPVQVGSMTNWKMASMSDSHTLVLTY